MGNIYGPMETDLSRKDVWICAPNVMSFHLTVDVAAKVVTDPLLVLKPALGQ